jgi:hypothetical protein
MLMTTTLPSSLNADGVRFVRVKPDRLEYHEHPIMRRIANDRYGDGFYVLARYDMGCRNFDLATKCHSSLEDAAAIAMSYRFERRGDWVVSNKGRAMCAFPFYATLVADARGDSAWDWYAVDNNVGRCFYRGPFQPATLDAVRQFAVANKEAIEAKLPPLARV